MRARCGRSLVLGVLLLGGGGGSAPARAEAPTPDRLDAAVERLRSSNPQRRREAVELLEELDPARVTPHLIRALTDGDTDVKLRAAGALGRMRVQGAVQPLIDRLGDTEAKVRLAAAEALGRLGSPLATAPLIRALGDLEHGVRQAAVVALERCGPRAALVPVLAHLDDEAVAVRRAAVDLVVRVGDRRAVVPLLGRLADPSAEVRAVTLLALGELGDAQVTPAVLRMLGDSTEEVRRAALEALGRLGAREATPTLLEMLRRPTDTQRDRALLALGGIARNGDEAATQALLDGLESTELRGPAREGLLRAGPVVVPALLLRMARRVDGNAVVWVDLLRDLGDPRATPALQAELLRGAVPRDRIADALGATRDRRAVPTLLSLLGDGDVSVRRRAVRALDGLVDARATQALLDASLGSDRDTRRQVVSLLGRLRSAAAVPRLLDLLAATDEEISVEAARALGQIGDPRAAAGLVAALRSSNAHIRRAAADALAELPPSPTLTPTLVTLVQSAHGEARRDALAALAGVRRRRPALEARPLLLGEATADVSRAEAALEALAAVRDPAAAPTLARLATGADNTNVRRLAAQALGDLGGEAARAPLLRALDDSDGSVRAEAAWALGKVGGPAAIAALRQRLAGAAPTAVRVNAVAALVRLGEPIAAAFLDDRDSHTRANAALGQARTEVDRLESMAANDPSPIARAAALRGLAHHGAADLAARVAARDTAPAVRRALVEIAAAKATLPSPTVGSSWARLYLIDFDAAPLAHRPFWLALPDGVSKSGVSDGAGVVSEEAVPPGPCALELDETTPTPR